MTRKHWTVEDDAQLAALWQSHTAAQIGEIMGRTKSSILQRKHVLGLNRYIETSDHEGLQIKIPRAVVRAGREEAARTGKSLSGVIASIVAEHFGIELPKGFNPWARNGGARIAGNAFPPRVPSLPSIPIGRD